MAKADKTMTDQLSQSFFYMRVKGFFSLKLAEKIDKFIHKKFYYYSEFQ